MSQTLSSYPRTIADSSGFPLQIRLSEVARSSSKWEVCVEEYPWRSTNNRFEGFIDLVLLHKEHQFQRMVIECKRVRQTAWVFLIPNPSPRQRSHARLWISKHDSSKWDNFGWDDFQIDPACHESLFCAIPGQDHGRRNSLEKTASELIEAVEGLAFHEKELHEKTLPTLVSAAFGGVSTSHPFTRVYIPILVTTAALQVASFEPKSISLSDGTLPDDAIFTPVPYVRFRKALTSRIDPTSNRSLKEDSIAAERTVFVVNAEKFAEFSLGTPFTFTVLK